MRGLVLVLLALAFVAKPAAAQVELDGSLGTTSGLVPGGVLPDGTSATYLIEESYGRRSGPNLFHSFSRFSIPTSRSAAFTGDPSIERVIGRVTGGFISQIDGALRNTIDGADLYLMNPRGFFFSGTASLDLRGSLYLSSADSLRFEDDLVFPATASAAEVLSFEPPSAWGFTSASAPGAIRFNQTRNLAVPLGETLAAVGGPVFVSGRSPTTTLLAPGGTIALASRFATGEVPVDVAALSARDAPTDDLGLISIATNSVLDVSDPSDLASSRGRIVIRGGSLTVTNSTLRSDSAIGASGNAPDIDLETTKSIALLRSNALLRATSLESAARGNAHGGGVRLSSETLTLTGASFAASTASGAAFAGPLEVTVGSLQLSEISRLATSATGDATTGRLEVNARTVGLSGGAQIASVNDASTDSPEIAVSAEELLQIQSGAILASQARGDGRGASLQIDARTLEQDTGGRIESATLGAGAAGDIEIDAEAVDLGGDPLGTDPGGVFAGSLGSRAAGRIRIGADGLVVSGGAQVSATIEGAGRGGDIEIATTHTLDLTGASGAGPSGVFARSGLGSGTTATGDGGAILIEAPVVVVTEGAEISAQTFGAGNASGIHIVAAESVRVAGGATAHSSINAKTASSGAGGSIVIETGELRIDDGGDISASTLYTGDSGDIRIEADSVHVGGGALSESGPAGIFAQSIKEQSETIAAGAAGDIEILAASLLELRRSAVISVKSASGSDAGNIRIVAPIVVVADGAEITAQTGSPDDATASGNGGDIEIRAANLLEVQSSGAISVRTRGPGDAGLIAIRGAELVSIQDGEISARSDASGAAGTVTLDGVGKLSVDRGGRITTETLRDGAGGLISIDVQREVVLSDGSEISARTNGSGAAGAIRITNADLVSLDRAEISARSEGPGAAGSVTIDGVGELVIGDGGSISSETLGDGVGGSITIGADNQVLVANGGRISALSAGTGDAGSIAINAGQRFSARNGGQVTTSAVAADGGDIVIGASRLIYVEEGRITTDVRAGLGGGGNITLDPEFVVLNRANVIASAIGDGGNITIQTAHFVRDSSSVVDASSELGIDGEIQTTSPTVDLTSELAQLDTTFLDASSKLAAACAARAGERGTFAVRGRARLASPEAPLDSEIQSLSPRDCTENTAHP